MIANLSPYPNYRSIGVPWLGSVPTHWEVRRLKHVLLRIVGGSTPTSTNPDYWDGDVVWVTPVDVNKETRLKNSLRKITRTGLLSCSSELVPCGSVVITSRAPVGNVALAETILCTNQGCKTLVLEDGTINSKFAFNVLSILKDELQSLATGTTFTEIATSKLGTVRIPLPPLAEQTAIVAYLDHADERIRRYVSGKQKLIQLLEEEKQGIIHRAVTRGIDPNVRLKPSGIEWLGDVPAHWEVVRNGQLFAQRNETGFPELPLLEVSLKTGVSIRALENSARKQMMTVRSDYKRAVKGDIAYNMMRMWQGAVGIAPVDGLVSPAYIIARPLHGTESRYFSTLFRTSAYMAEVDKYSRGIVKDRNRLYWEDFKQMPSLRPPLYEQTDIVAYLDKTTAYIDTAISHARRQIELLQEYRTRLIADVVTGKIDVREAAKGLPDEIDEPEPLEMVGEPHRRACV